MRRALWVGAVLLAVAGFSCEDSPSDTGGANLGEAGVGLPDGGSLTDESGTGSVAPRDTTAATFAGIKSATALSETQIGVTWDPATDDKTAQGTIAYRIYVAEVAGGQIFTSPVVTAPAGATGATIAGLHAFKQYFIVVRSVDGSGNEDTNTVALSATTLDIQAPTFAGAKSVAGTAANDVLVSWEPATDNGSEQAGIHYEVYATTTQGGEHYTTATATTAAGATSATLTGLPEAATIFAVVRAVDGAGNKDANKHEVSGLTLDKTPPTFAGVTTAAPLGTTINLDWADATDNFDDKSSIVYDVFQSTTAGGQDFTTPTFTTLPGALSASLTNLAVSTKYHYVVRARDSAKNVDQNLVEKSATTAASPDIKPPTFAGLGAAVATTDQTIDLSWTAATDDFAAADQIVYDIFIASAAGGEVYGAAPSYTTVGGATNFTVTGLLPSAKSYFVVRARDAAGNRDTNTIEKSATTLADTIPPTFAGLTSATANGPTSIQLAWTPASDDISSAAAIQYRVFMAASSGGETYAVPSINVAAGQLSTVVSNLAPATAYYFVVRAVDEANNADGNTTEKTAKTLSDTTAPTFGGATAITSLSATSITVSWSSATDDVTPSNQIVYLPYLATSAGGQNFLVAPTPTAANATSHTFNGLAPNTPYYVVVRARDAAWNVDTNVVEKTLSTQGDTTAPTFAGALSVGSATDQSLKVSWNAASDNSTPSANLTYLVCMTQTDGGCAGLSFVATATVTGGATNRTFTGLTPAIKYHFVVRARDAFGNVDTNNIQRSGDTLADLVPPTFAGLTAATSTTPTTIDLAWAAGSDDLNTAAQLVYDVYQSNTTGGQNFASATYTSAAGATTYKVTGLLPGQQRFYVVRARDQAGNSDSNVVQKSATVQSDTTAPTFGGVTSVTATGLTSLNAAWNAATDNVAAQQGSIVYYVCWSTSTSCTTTFTAMATTAAGALNHSITGLLANTSYNVVVRAHDVNGNTDANVVTIARTTNADTTAPVSPAGPQVTGTAATSLTVAWPAATDNYSAQSTLRYLVCMSTSSVGCSGASFTPTVTLTNTLSHTFTSLVNLQTYYFVVRAQDQANNIDVNSNVVSGQTSNDTTPPTFGHLTTATALSATSIQLNWSAGADNVSTPAQLVYDIYQATSSGAESYVSPTYTSAAGAVQYVVNNLLPATNYYFVVRARDSAGNRDASTTEKTAKTLADTTPPTFVGVTSVSVISDSQLQANWSLATDNTTASSAITYQICWAVGAGCTGSFAAMATAPANSTSYTTAVRALVPATAYTFVVRAVDAFGNVDTNTYTASNTTLADTVVPTFAGATSVTGVTYKTATVNWAAGSDDYTTTANMRYAICVTTSSGGCNNASFSAFATVTNQTSYSFAALTPNTPYWFVVRAQDQANNFNTTNNNLQVTATTPQETNPPTFTAGLTSANNPTSSSVLLTWSAATDDYSTAAQMKYNVYVSTTSGGQNFVAAPYAANLAGVAGVNTYTVTGLSPGTAYYFVVRAEDAAGNMDSNVVQRTATTLPTVPSFSIQPYSTGATTSAISIDWAASSTPASSITYQYCYSTTNGSCISSFVAAAAASATSSANLTSLAANTTYYFVVRATNSAGTTTSSQGSATTDPTPPTMSGSVTCNTNNSYPSYLNITSPAATTGSLSVTTYETCWDTSSGNCLSGTWSNMHAQGGVPNNMWIGSPFGSTPYAGSLTNGPALTQNTGYYVRVRAKDIGGNYSNVIGSALCTTPISGSQSVNPWFSANCNGCHTGTSYPGPWTTAFFSSDNTAAFCATTPYVSGGSLANSYIYQKVIDTTPACGGIMPVGTPSLINSSLLQKWITQGGYNN